MSDQLPTLKELYANHRGKVSDKWEIYIAEYDRLFQPYRDQPVSVLEIGIQNGGSLEIWNKFFPNVQKIVGCDINPACAQLQFDDPKIRVIVANANSDDAERCTLSESKGFDLIIDDGSHQSGDIVRSFARYFKHLLDGGLYVAEDLHCSYWKEFEGGIFQPYSSIAFFKRLADIINHEHWGVDKTRQELLATFNQKYCATLDEATLKGIHSIEFINSMCVVKRATPLQNHLGRRFIAGTQAAIDSAPLPLHGTSSGHHDQSTNTWSTQKSFPEDEAKIKAEELAALERRFSELTQELSSVNETITLLQKGKDEVINTGNARVDKLVNQIVERETAFTVQLSKLQLAHAATTAQLVAQNQQREQISISDANKAHRDIEEQLLLHVAREKEFSENLAKIHASYESMTFEQTRRYAELKQGLQQDLVMTRKDAATARSSYESTTQEQVRLHAEYQLTLRQDLFIARQETEKTRAAAETRAEEQIREHANQQQTLRLVASKANDDLAAQLKHMSEREAQYSKEIGRLLREENNQTVAREKAFSEKLEALNVAYETQNKLQLSVFAKYEQAFQVQLDTVRKDALTLQRANDANLKQCHLQNLLLNDEFKYLISSRSWRWTAFLRNLTKSWY